MPPKGKKGGKGKKGKKGKGKKKGAKKESGPEELSSGERLAKLEATILGLERKLEERTEEVFENERVAGELRGKVSEYEEEWKRNLEERDDIIADMTRQFKEKQEELCEKLNTLENIRAELVDRVEMADIARRELEQEKNYTITLKDRYLAEQREKEKRVHEDFKAMLKDTLARLIQCVRDEEERTGKGVGDTLADISNIESYLEKLESRSVEAS